MEGGIRVESAAGWIQAIASGKVGLDDRSLRSLLSEPGARTVPPELPGQLYERHLAAGPDGGRKAAGVYYTPAPVVGHIVSSTLGPLTAGKAPGAGLRVVDPACGAGSFLLAAHDYLANWYGAAGADRSRLVTDHLFGVDLDPHAVAVAKLSLWLRLLADGCPLAALPCLDRNIQCGNALTMDWAEAFPGRGPGLAPGFDAVIGNPPYVSHGLRDTGKLSQQAKEYYRTRFAHAAEYKISLYPLFIQLGVELLRESGVCSYIVPDSFLLGRFSARLRRYLLDTCRVDRLTLLQAKVFSGATVGRSVIFRLTRTAGAEVRQRHLVTAVRCDRVEELDSGGHSHRYPQAYFAAQPLHRFRLFFSQAEQALVDRMEAPPAVPLGQLVSLSSGLIGKGGKASITAPAPPGPEWRPGLLSGEEISRYAVRWQGGYICYDPGVLKSGFRDARYHEPKLLCRQTGDRLVWAYDDQGLLCLNNLHVGNFRSQAVHPFFLLGLLNARLMSAYYQVIALEAGRVLAQTDIDMLSSLPMRLPAEQGEHDRLVELVGQRLAATREAAAADLDRQIDQAVEALYGVTL